MVLRVVMYNGNKDYDMRLLKSIFDAMFFQGVLIILRQVICERNSYDVMH